MILQYFRCSSSLSCWQTHCTPHCPLSSCPQSQKRSETPDLFPALWLLLKCRIWRTELHTTGPWRNSSTTYTILNLTMNYRLICCYIVILLRCCGFIIFITMQEFWNWLQAAAGPDEGDVWPSRRNGFLEPGRRRGNSDRKWSFLWSLPLV